MGNMNDYENGTTDAVDVAKGGAVFQHCVKVYGLMGEQAVAATIDGKPILMYEGFVTKLFEAELHLANSYYSQVMSELKRMGCVSLIRRGGGQSPSRWALLKEPTYEDYQDIGGKEYRQGGPKSSRNLAAMQEMYRDMQARYEEMAQNYNTMSHAILKLGMQVSDIETQLNRLEIDNEQ